jgi:membrane associated rhomboid family serine protease
MFPIRDDNPTLHTSVATFAIVGINIIIWVLVQGMGFGAPLLRSVWEFGLIPGELLHRLAPGTEIPVAQGMAYLVEGHPKWYTLFTHMFLHSGWLHIIGNMWFLLLFGDNVEDAMGSVKFVAFYLLCGLAAAGAQMLSSPGSAVPMVGASGAIGGVMGAYALLYPRAPVHMLVFLGFFVTRVVVPAYLMLGYWFLLQFLGGLPSLGSASGGVAFWAHIGGFAVGVALAKPFCDPQRLEMRRQMTGRTDGLIRRHVRQPDLWA